MRRTLAVLAAAALLAGCGARPEAGEFTGTVLDPPFEVDGAALVAADGSPYSLTRDTDRPLTLVFFGYTHCPDICGIVMSTIGSAIARLDAEDRAKVDVVFVTTDPARDDEEVVGSYATNFGDDFIGLTGDLPTIVAVGKPLGIGVEKGERLPTGGYDVTHGTQVIGIDSQDKAPVYWNHEVSSAQLAADIEQLLSE